MFDFETRNAIARARFDQLQGSWGSAPSPARRALGTWLIRLGRRLAPERRPSALAHEALPRC
jgi:hypothetical protein